MKLLVGYNGSSASKAALNMACQEATRSGSKLYVVSSMMGGTGEHIEDIQQVEEILEEARKVLEKEKIDGETVQLVRGLSPAEDLIQFAEDTGIDHIYIGIEKTSRARKILLGSTAQYVILKAPCPVTTIK